MKYKDLDNSTFSKRFNKENDHNGIGSLMEGLFEEDRDKSLKALAKHKRLSALHEKQKPEQFKVFGCPVCGDVYFDEDKAEHCADGEKQLLKKFAGAKVGDWVKYEVKTFDPWTDLSVGDVFYKEITSFSHCYSGFHCGKILTIHTNGDAITAESMEYWSLTTEKEYKEHKRKKALLEIDKLKKDIGEQDDL